MKPIGFMSYLFATAQVDRIYQIKLLWICCFLLHTILDPAITYVAVAILEVGIEANPFIRRYLNAGIVVFVAIHLPIYVIGVIGYVVLRWLVQHGTEDEQRRVYYLSIITLVGINIWGAVLVLNNLRVIWIMS
jgi:hypothetical protein